MKFTAVTAILAMAAAQSIATPGSGTDAAPIPMDEPDTGPDAYPLARRFARRRGGFCGIPGQSCQRVRNADPDPKGTRWGYCGIPGQSCVKPRDAEDDEQIRSGHVSFCGTPGQPCALAKRMALSLAETLADADARRRRRGGRWGFCGVPGQACHKARQAIDEVVDNANAVYGAIYEREARIEARSPQPLNYNSLGQKPWKKPKPKSAKKKPLGQAAALKRSKEIQKKDKAARKKAIKRMKKKNPKGMLKGKPRGFIGKRPSFRKPAWNYRTKTAPGSRIGMCGVPGAACPTKRSTHPRALHAASSHLVRRAYASAESDARASAADAPHPRSPADAFRRCAGAAQACSRATDPIGHAVADSLHALDPLLLREQCFAPGGECHTLLRMRTALHDARTLHARAAADPDPASAFCHAFDCPRLTLERAAGPRGRGRRGPGRARVRRRAGAVHAGGQGCAGVAGDAGSRGGGDGGRGLRGALGWG